MRSAIVTLMAVLAMAGCSTTAPGIGGGTVVGGFAGQPVRPASVPASQAIVQAMGGGLVASIGGEGLSQAERSRAIEAEYRALEHTPLGQSVTWGERSGGRYGEVTAAQPYRVGSQDCRQYTHTLHLGGEPRVARGTACRNPDGSWSLLI